MPRRRTVPAALALIAILAMRASAGNENVVRIVAPEPDAILDGPFEMRVEVAATEPPVERVDVFVDGRLCGTLLPPEWRRVIDAAPGPEGAKILAVAYADGKIAGRATAETRALGVHDSVQVEMVQMFPVVVDRRGRYVRDLVRDDFRVLDSGRPVEIEAFDVESPSLTVALILDVSGSMADRLVFLQEASRRFIGRLEPEDRVGVFAFNETVSRLVDIGVDHAAARESLTRLRAAGATALYDAVAQTLRELRATEGRKAIFVYSDGEDNRSILSFERVVGLARDANAIVFPVRPTGRERAPRTPADEDLVRLATDSGGRALFLASIEELDGAYDDVIEFLRAQYVVAWTAPPGPPGIRPVEIGAIPPGLRVIHRRSYRKR